MATERLFFVVYDVASPKRWRRVFRLMKGYGAWVQLSVFQCRLSARRRADMAARLERLIKRDEDHVVIIDVGEAESVDPRIESLGKSFEVKRREAIVV